MQRRHFIKSTAYGLSGIMLETTGNLLGFSRPAFAQSETANPFARAFNLPPLDTGIRKGKKVHFNLNLATGESNFFGNVVTPTIGVNGPYLGPVLRARRGDRVSFGVTNQLKFDTTLHWHGFILPARMDGGPHQVIESLQTWNPEFDVNQPAATNWYHAHLHKYTGIQVYHGLAGLFIIDDAYSLDAALPSEYGIDDFPVVIQDRAFNGDGAFRYLGSMPDRMRGMHGNTIMVNGVITPTLTASRATIRLRILNGSNARIYNLGFHDFRPFEVIAGDGGFLPAPEKVQSIRLSPGERAEILLDLSGGDSAILKNIPLAGSARGGMMGMMNAGNEAFSIMKINPSSSGQAPFKTPSTLVPLPDWRQQTIAQSRSFRLEMAMGPRMMMPGLSAGGAFSISGQSMNMDVINHRVKSNTFEIWDIGNASMLPHPFHIHNTQFKVLQRSGRKIPATERGLKDTVLVHPREIVRLQIPFPAYNDPERPYMYHCHILEHEDGGMMGQFTVEA